MKRKLTFLFALLCASVMGFATQYCGESLTLNGGAEIQLSCIAVSEGNYQIIIEGENLNGLGGSFYNPGAVDLRTAITTNTSTKIVCDIAAASAPSLYTPLYVLCPGEQSIGWPNDVEWAACGGSGGGGGETPEPESVSYCDVPTGHESNPNFGDANGRILLSIEPTANANEYKLTVKPNYANGATKKLDYLYVIAGGNSPYPAEAGADEGGTSYDELSATFTNSSASTSFTIQWSNPDWGGRWQCAVNDVPLKQLAACAGGGSDPEPTEIYDVNFALASNGSSATASSGTAANAIDGNEGSRWESASTDDETWTLDMGQKRIFNTIKILWEGAYCKEFNLTYSNDGENWSPLYTETNLTSAGWQTIELADKVTAQYIKYHGTLRATGWGQSFFEFQVLLPGVSTLTSITLSAAAAIAEAGGAGVALTAQPKDQNGQNMEAEVSYEITPAAAGHMSGNTFIPDQAGSASIRAYNGEVYSPAVTIVAYSGSNVALEKDVEANGYDTEANLYPAFAVDNNEGSLWSARTGETGAERVYDAWIIVDLGAFYDINLIAIRWEGACSKHYHVDFSADKSAWRTAYNAGWDAVATHWEYLSGTAEDATKVRYVRVWSTEAVSQYGVKIMDLKVFGTEWVDSGDTEAPVMTSASLVSSTSTSAIIAVEATDADGEVARYHVVDATNGIDAKYVPEAGNITITGLTHATNYNFTITAEDLANHESENSIVVPVSTPFDVTVNLALNKTCEAGYEDGNPAETAAKANDGDENTSWVTYADRPASEEWWYVDLGDVYTLSNITVVWGEPCATNYILQARVEAPATADKADDAAWITLATVTDGAINSTKSTNVTGIGRYVRIRALARSANFFRLKELRVFGTGKVAPDTEKPVMGAASLVSNTDSHAIISVAATDNTGIASFHVVDNANGIDATLAPVEGKITVTGLTGNTNYTLVIKAVDLFGNESENSQSVEVATVAHMTAPAAACPAPTLPAAQVKAMYSPTYDADYTHQDWGSGTVATKDEFGRKYVTNGNGYFGADGFSLNCLMMEKLHYDIWIENDATIRFVPIWGGAEQGITKHLVGQEWNSIDIDLTAYTGITNWGNIYQMKIDQAYNLTFWVANAYFYREAAYVDTEAPTSVSASVTATGFHSVQITAQAEDNSGAVSFKVMNGEEILATGTAVTGVATTIIVNGLTAGTAYNFNVVAYDDANNAAAPVAVEVTTKTVPAPAPAPVTSGKVIVPVYSDALADSKTGIQSGGWGETTQVEWLEIAPNDQVFYGQNFNFAGWHSWGASIDATNMMFLHVDFYSTGMTQVSVTPISPGHEGVANCALTPNAWTSVDVPLSSYTGIDWTDIFQFKFMNPVGGKELMIDNVYFWQPQVTALPVQGGDPETGGWATFSCAEKVAVPAGMKAYKAAYSKTATEEVLTLTEVSVIPAGEGVILRGEPGVEYTFLATIEGTPDMSDNSLVGCPVRTDVSAVRENKDIFCMRYSELFGITGFFLYEGQYVPAGKAYLPLDKEPGVPNSAPRNVRFVFNNEQVVTGMDNVDAQPVEAIKFIENGQLLIRRGDTVYNIQGVRVR